MNKVVALFAVWTISCHFATVTVQSALAAATLSSVLTFLLLITGAYSRWRIRNRRPSEPLDQHYCNDGSNHSLAPVHEFTLAGVVKSRTALLYILTALALPSIALFPTVFVYALVLIGVPYFYSLAMRVYTTEPCAPTPVHSTSRHLRLRLIALSLIFLGIALATNRPDLDDSYHINIAQLVASNPVAPLYHDTRLMFGEPSEFWLPTVWKWQTLFPLVGMISYILNCDSMLVAHLLLPTVGSLLVTFAYFSLFNELSPKRAISLTALTLVILLALGADNTTIGNFGGFVRLHHGIGILLTAGVPLLTAGTIRLLTQPSPARFVELSSLAVASVGLSATALVVTPIVVAVTAVSQCRLTSHFVKRLAICMASALYPIGISLYTVLYCKDPKGAGAYIPSDVAIDGWLYASLYLTLGPWSAMLPALILAMVGWLGADTVRAARLCVFGPLAGIVLVFNPISIRILSQFAILPQVYYRLVCILNLPVLIAYALHKVTIRYKERDTLSEATHLVLSVLAALLVFRIYCWFCNDPAFPPLSGFLWINFLVLLMVFLVVSPTPLFLTRDNIIRVFILCTLFLFLPYQHVLNSNNATFGNTLTVGVPSRKVPRTEYQIAAFLHRNVRREGTLLAPTRISAWVTTFKDNPRPLVATGDLLPSSQQVLPPHDFDLRERLQKFVENPEVQQSKITVREMFDEAFALYPLTAIVLYTSQLTIVDQEQFAANGFKRAQYTDQYEIWIKTQ